MSVLGFLRSTLEHPDSRGDVVCLCFVMVAIALWTGPPRGQYSTPIVRGLVSVRCVDVPPHFIADDVASSVRDLPLLVALPSWQATRKWLRITFHRPHVMDNRLRDFVNLWMGDKYPAFNHIRP